MRRLLASRSGAVLIVAVVGIVMAAIFDAVDTFTVPGVIVGAALGVWWAQYSRAQLFAALSRVPGHYFGITVAIGFFACGLIAINSGIVWPFVVWSIPAGLIEGALSIIASHEMKNAS
jgi:hypothetical protein